MAVIVVTDLTNVSVDGIASGSVTDVLANFKNVAGIRGDLLRAIQAWDTARIQAASATCTAQLDDLRTLKNAKIDELQAKVDALQAKVADQQALIDALGGTLQAKQMRRQAQRQAALDAISTAEAELAAIDATPIDVEPIP